jgi:hypothetical protein
MTYGSAVELTSLLTPSCRIIDVGATGHEIAATLARNGCERYLGLVAPERLAEVRGRAGDLSVRFHPLTSAEQAVRNSTDLLVLRGPLVRRLWPVRDLKHAKYVAIETGAAKVTAEARLAAMAGQLAGKLAYVGSYTCGSSRFDVIELPGRRASRPRHYLSPVWGVTGLVERLRATEVDYVALRWFEDLPHLEPGEDLDLLVADRDLHRLQALLLEEPGTIPVDVYSESGVTGSDYQGVAYYPPALARRILDRAVTHTSGCRVPAPDDHLNSLAYHAVYHKGGRSGLLSSVLGHRMNEPEHDYPAVLQDLARASGVDLPGSLEGVDEFLDRAGWRPPPDTLRRLAPANPWIQQRFFRDAEAAPDPPEVTVFFVRERTTSVVPMKAILDVLDGVGFDVLLVHDLDEAAKLRCSAQARGGNWSRGPFPASGGGPATVIVALHHAPQALKPRLRAQYPRLTNADVLRAKLAIRNLVGAGAGPGSQFNAVHSSDTESEAWEYIALALPDQALDLREQVLRRRAQYRTELPVVEELSRGRRAKVELVRSDDGRGALTVRKTFAAGYRRHMERELHGLRELGPHVDAVPDLLDSGPNWFTTPYYENQLGEIRPTGRLLPLRVVRAMVDVLQRIHEQGYELIDAKPQHFLLDPQHGLKVVDLEFLYRSEGPPRTLTESYTLMGPPESFTGDVPADGLSYDWRWRRFTGLSPASLVGSPPWSQHIQRALFRLSRTLSGPRAPARRAVRLSRRQAHAARRRIGARYGRWATRRAQHSADFPI